MTRAGEKLYGDFNRAYARERIIGRRFWIGFIAMTGVLMVAVVVGSIIAG